SAMHLGQLNFHPLHNQMRNLKMRVHKSIHELQRSRTQAQILHHYYTWVPRETNVDVSFHELLVTSPFPPRMPKEIEEHHCDHNPRQSMRESIVYASHS